MIQRFIDFISSFIFFHFTPDNHVSPVLRFGHYHRAEKSGYFWTIPLLERTLPSVKTSIYVANYTFRKVTSRDNIPFSIEMTVLFSFNPAVALKNAAAVLVRADENLLRAIVRDYTNRGLRRLAARYEAEQLRSTDSMSAIERDLTSHLRGEIQPLGIVPLRKGGLLIKEVVGSEKFEIAIVNARRLEVFLHALARFPAPGLVEQAIQAGFITNLEDLESDLTFLMSGLSPAESAHLPLAVDPRKMSTSNGPNGHSRR